MAKGTQFTLDNLRLLDLGKISAAFNVELERCVRDCQDRPADDHARKISINFCLVPVPSDQPGQLDLDGVEVECEITSTVPKRRTRPYRMRVHQDGKLSFNPDHAEDPEEEDLFDADERRQDRAK